MSPVVLVCRVGAARGSRGAAAALACAASEPERAALLIDLGEGRPRSTLVATSGARALEERLAAHLPDAAVASRGRFCRLTLPADPAALDSLRAALPLARESAAVIHLSPPLLRPLLDAPRIRPTAALLRADLVTDRALTALTVGDLMARGLGVAVLKRPLAWLPERVALLGALGRDDRIFPERRRRRLLAVAAGAQ